MWRNYTMRVGPLAMVLGVTPRMIPWRMMVFWRARPLVDWSRP